jgi:hypothetical protein
MRRGCDVSVMSLRMRELENGCHDLIKFNTFEFYEKL